MKKNILIIAGACLLFLSIVCVAAALSSFYGNPLEAALARGQMETYLAKTYPGKRFTIQEVRYNFKVSGYEAAVVEGDSNEFILDATAKGVQFDQYRITYAMDEPLTTRFNDQYQAALAEILRPLSPAFYEASPDLYVAKNTYPPEMNFQNGMEADTRLEIFLMGEMLPKADFVDQCVKMRDAILKAGYQPSRVRFLYNLPEIGKTGSGQAIPGMLLYTLKIEKAQFQAQAGELISQVEEYNQNKWK